MQSNQNESQILADYVEQRDKEEVQAMQCKKAYLKENILDVYIKQDQLIDAFLDFFLLFLSKFKGIHTQDHNLEYLTLDQLKQLVAEFKKMHPLPENTTVVQIENSLDVNMVRNHSLHEPKIDQFDAQKVYYANGSWDYELEGYEECKRVKPFFSLEEGCKNIVVIFQKQEIRKSGGFFGIGCTSELWIEMRTNLFKQHVTRKIEDFLVLRNWLTKCFPFVFIYPLDITEKQLENVTNQAVRAVLVSECRRFINHVCKNELLLQCFYTHRFFKENNFQNFINNRKKGPKEPPNYFKALENSQGCVHIEISDKNQLIKKDFLRKSEELERIWIKFDEANTRIAGKLKQVQGEIEKERRDMERMILEFTNVNPLLKSKVYEAIISTMINYSEIFKNYQENIGNFQFLFDSLNLQVAAQARKTWSYFTKYAKEISTISLEYSARRKVFLQKQAKRMEQVPVEKSEGKRQQRSPGGGQQLLDPVNRSIISNLGISSNSIKETAWIERFSKWQGYMNKQFTCSFERQLETDVDNLRKILQQNLINRCEMHRKEESLIKSLQQQAF